MNPMKSLTSLAVATMTAAGCVTLPPTSAEMRQLDAGKQAQAIATEREQQIKTEQEEYRKKFQDTLLFLGEDTSALIKDSSESVSEVVAEGFTVPFASDVVSKTLHSGEEVRVVTKVATTLNNEVTKNMQLYVYFFEGAHYFGVGTKDKHMAMNLSYKAHSIVTEPRPGVIRIESAGLAQPFFHSDTGLDAVFGRETYYGLISDENKISVYDRPQTVQIYWSGEHVASIEFRLLAKNQQ